MFHIPKRFDPAIREVEEILNECEERGLDDLKKRLEKVVQLAEVRDKYSESVSSPPSPALASLHSDTIAYPFQKAFDEGKTIWNLQPIMLSGHVEGKFLQSIIAMTGAKRVLEIGTFTGYAALACAEALPEDGTVTTCEFDPYLEKIAKEFFSRSPHGKKITLKIGQAKEILVKMVEDKERFDLVFIDADKSSYLDYLKLVVDQNILSPGGTVVVDNALIFGYVYIDDCTSGLGKGVKDLNDYLKTRDDLFRVLLPMRDGVLIVRRKSETFR